jgi:hypothetical protein
MKIKFRPNALAGKAHVKVSFMAAIFCSSIANVATAQVQQGLPSLPPLQQAPSNNPPPASTLGQSADSQLQKQIEMRRDANEAKDARNLRKSTGPLSTSNCTNCGTLLSVTESRKKAKPIWMTSTDPNDPSNQDEKLDGKGNPIARRADDVPIRTQQKATQNQVVLGGTLSKPETGISLQRRQGFEVLVQMEDGSNKLILMNMRPAYNIGAKVRVLGNSLLPR